MIDVLKTDVLPNPYIWLFALSYFFVYLVRQGTSTWFVHYMINVKGVSDLGKAAGLVSGLEVGGFLGALSAGKSLQQSLAYLAFRSFYMIFFSQQFNTFP